jgi:hypothetical protein
VELAAERRELETTLALDPAAHCRDDAVTAVVVARGRLSERQADQAHAHQRLEELQAAPRRRRSRQGLELARRQVDRADQAVAVAENTLGAAEDRLRAAEVGARAQEPVRQRLDVLDAALEAKVADAVDQASPYLEEALGRRPADPKGRRTWDERATAIENYRHGTLGVEPSSGQVGSGSAIRAAIGPEPDDLAAAFAWRHAARRIDREMERELARGLGIEL